MAFDDVNKLCDAEIKKGDIFLYSADFNVLSKGKLKSTDRIDIEIPDLEYIIGRGGRVAILAHQGRFKDGDTESLEPIAKYLLEKINCIVDYCPENTTDKALAFVKDLGPGEIGVMGNTRFHEGEEKNDSVLAKQFAALAGEEGRAAIGGFGKAHRAHSSNAGILDYLKGYITKSQLIEMKKLESWAAKDQGYSVAVLGGIKKEKITEGLVGFAKTYDAIIPGGIVLNTILYVQGKKVGASIIDEGGKTYDKQVKAVLEEYGSKVCVPEEVVVARKDEVGYDDTRNIKIANGVPDGYMIVDFVLPDSAHKALEAAVSEKGRIVLAGTPGIYTKGFKTATDAIIDAMNCEGVAAIALGGDTVKEVNCFEQRYNGPKSTGGGASLYYVAHGTTPVYEALKLNKQNFV